MPPSSLSLDPGNCSIVPSALIALDVSTRGLPESPCLPGDKPNPNPANPQKSADISFSLIRHKRYCRFNDNFVNAATPF
jgi:hypothetical protein